MEETCASARAEVWLINRGNGRIVAVLASNHELCRELELQLKSMDYGRTFYFEGF